MVIVSKNAFNMDVSKQNSNSASSASTITNNINVISRAAEGSDTIEVQQNDSVNEILQQQELINDQQYDALLRENRALRLILDINKSNPLIINDFIVAQQDKLGELIQALTGADEVEVVADELVVGCIAKNKYRKVLSIYVKKGDVSENFKYSYGDANRMLNDEKISIKFVF